MRHARLTIEYDGRRFRGWSRQPGLRTIEGELRSACDELGLEVSELYCAGRTDSGVHARMQVVSLSYDGDVPTERLGGALAAWLPPDIGVIDSGPCDRTFNARHDC